MIPQYNTKLLTDVWETENDFKTYMASTVFANDISITNISILYHLLCARYGNNPIANLTENQFKLKVAVIIHSFGPTWQRKNEIQTRLRALTEDDLLKGSKAINNRVYNPNTEPSTSALEEIPEINEQATQNFKKSVMDAYSQLWIQLDARIDDEFIDKFKGLFKTFVAPESPLLYVTPEEDEE